MVIVMVMVMVMVKGWRYEGCGAEVCGAVLGCCA